MVQFSDPITDVSYDPVGNPVGTAKKVITVVGGLAMTLFLFKIADGEVVPTMVDGFNKLTGRNMDNRSAVGANGGGL